MRRRAWDLLMRAMNLGHRVVLRVSGGRWLTTAFGMPTVELHTTGRRSGQRRSVMLTAPMLERDRVVLVASKGGDDRHPDWYRNLVATPQISLTIDGVESAWTARTATPAERAELWPRITSAYAGYSAYQSRTDREIPVVICEPLS